MNLQEGTITENHLLGRCLWRAGRDTGSSAAPWALQRPAQNGGSLKSCWMLRVCRVSGLGNTLMPKRACMSSSACSSTRMSQMCIASPYLSSLSVSESFDMSWSLAELYATAMSPVCSWSQIDLEPLRVSRQIRQSCCTPRML